MHEVRLDGHLVGIFPNETSANDYVEHASRQHTGEFSVLESKENSPGQTAAVQVLAEEDIELIEKGDTDPNFRVETVAIETKKGKKGSKLF